MRLKAEHVDMRGGYPTDVYWPTDVTDLDSGMIVGTIHNERPRLRRVSIFDGKHEGDFKSADECDAFLKGVEVVLNHVTAFTEPKADEQAA
jgi:hypothetical protein